MNNINGIPKELLNRLKRAKTLLNSENCTIRVISHYDADGICAAGILCHVLTRENKKFHVTLTKSLKDDFVKSLEKEQYALTIFCDMGSGYLAQLKEFQGKVIILDHHRAQEDSEEPLLINSHFFGIDGTYEVCAASLAFMFSLVINEDNWDLSALALAGIIGDKQHMQGLTGFNAEMVDIAKEKGIVVERKTLKLNSTSIKKGLLEGLDPFIRGMSGREDKVLEFLRNMSIDPDLTIENLKKEEKQLLASAVIVKLLSQNVQPFLAEGFITKKYWLPRWNLYATDLSNYINSCGRMDNMGMGLALCLGEEDALLKAKELRTAYKDELRGGLLKLESAGPHLKKNIQFFYTDNSSLAGAKAGLGMMYLFNQEKPTFALSVRESETKVSSRGTRYLISKGLDLSEACRVAAGEMGGRGGGHPIASGATIPKGKEEAFLDLLDDIVGKQFVESVSK